MKEDFNSIVSSFVKIGTNTKAELFNILPDLANGLFVIVVGVILAYTLRWIATNTIRWSAKIIPNQFYQNSIIRKNVSSFALGVGNILFYIVILMTIVNSFRRMGFEVISIWFQSLVKYLPNVATFFIIIYLGWKLKDVLMGMLHPSFSRAGFSHARLATNALSWSVFVISAIIAFELIGLDMSLIITITGIIGGISSGGIALAIALGAKSTVSNILSCYQIQKYLQVGQEISIGPILGTVEAIGPTVLLISTSEGTAAIAGSIFTKEHLIIRSQNE